MSEQLPLHGIHYWELKIKTYPLRANSENEEEKKSENDQRLSQYNRRSGPKIPKYLFVGVC
jgi:hypothetical protein